MDPTSTAGAGVRAGGGRAGRRIGSLIAMHAPSAGRAANDLARFRRLTSATIVATFALIVIGGIVRVSDSGLGCGPAGSGTEGWPLCGGRVLPFLRENALIEFSHRALASLVVLLIAALAIQ